MSFSVGAVSASEGDAFSTDLIADSDTSDVLVALGLNAFLTGTDAATIDMRDDIREDPRLLAASATGAVGDGGALLDMIGVQTKDVAEIGSTLGEYYGSIVGDVGFEISSTSNAQEIESFLLESLDRAARGGVRRQRRRGAREDDPVRADLPGGGALPAGDHPAQRPVLALSDGSDDR